LELSFTLGGQRFCRSIAILFWFLETPSHHRPLYHDAVNHHLLKLRFEILVQYQYRP